jgi:hypothetical protein
MNLARPHNKFHYFKVNFTRIIIIIIIIIILSYTPKTKLNSVALVFERTIPNERPPFVGEASTNLLRIEGVAWLAQRIPTAVFSAF